MAWVTGYPRESIEWYPSIDEAKCVQCGICMNCGKQVFQWTDEGPVAAKPYSCVVGCSTCANLCKGDAISFPDLAKLRHLYRKEGIWQKVRRQLVEEGKIPGKGKS